MLSLNLFPNVNYNMDNLKQCDSKQRDSKQREPLMDRSNKSMAFRSPKVDLGPRDTLNQFPLIDSEPNLPTLAMPSDPLLGKVVGGYTLLELLGKGGMGVVYLAEVTDKPEAPKVAVKILASDPLGDNQQNRDRFFVEAAAVLKLHHPNIVEGFNIGEFENHRLFIAMEYLHGRDLATYIEENGAMPLDKAVRVMLQVCDGMQAAHDAGILHRDLKLENIFLLEPGFELVKIVDLGLAKSMRPESSRPLTEAGVCQGTPEYMAPEQCLGKPVGHSVDIYAAGVVLYYLLADCFPFESPTKQRAPLIIMLQHVNEKPEAPSVKLRRLHPESDRFIPHEFDRIVMHAMEKDPKNRFQSMAEFKAALLEAASANGLDLGLSAGEVVERPVQVAAVKRRQLPINAFLALAFSAALFTLSATSFFVFRHSEEATAKKLAEVQQPIQTQSSPKPIEEPPLVPIVKPKVTQPYIVTIKTNPPGALIELCEQNEDGIEWRRKIATTPISTRLSHEGLIVISHDGYFPAYIEASPENNVFNLTLKPMPPPK